ncbi:F-box protein CPR1-like isoform X2 [Arachis stenosperma]|uniref:F-box protein CPR1-like isoform X2 n=1 Tax=Arachis stenosperma TaxID=217475 RepID=UPI0025AD2CC1|nr:F-box protein CPR1-like isoform X2 [Arachis stenosperma]
MDKKKQEHTGNKPKQQSTMEKKKKKKKQHQQNENHKSKSIHDTLPLELIHRILLRVPLRHLVRLKCVSKLWHSLISDPDFAESHVHLSAAPTHVCLLINDYSEACSVDIDTIFHGYKHATAVKEWCFAILYGFGYDASQDDYLVVVASRDKNGQDHFDCLSLRTNSWINLDSALPKTLGVRNWESCGFFLNGAIHWSSCTLGVKDYSILIFDLKEKSFSTISMPEQVMCYLKPTRLALLGGCLALYSYEYGKTNIWVMKEYKVHSSWTFYQISRGECVPLCLSNGSDIVALDPAPISTYTDLRFVEYNARGELRRINYFDYPHLQHFKYSSHGLSNSGTNYTVYTESLVSLPSDIKDKDRDKGQEEEKRPSESEGCQTGKEN